MPDNATITLLKTRRSVKPDLLALPAPSAEELETILTIASRVPDHKKLAPWRFVIIEGAARAKLGELAAEACKREEAEPPSHVRLDTERKRFLRAPLVIAVVSRVKETRGAPEWEQILSAGAACMNLCVAANALGYGTTWITEWISYSKTFGDGFGLAANERIAGFVHIGTATQKPDERERPALADVVTRWGA
ncbi:MAG: nitroreductase [Hyphomicrobium sp.]|nr:nitroreductase [Hyphomicrobium sp.]PPD06166.1 MAG: nitroreductase [Hyphomicrobium sp.]